MSALARMPAVTRLDPADPDADRLIRACHAVNEAAARADDPHAVPESAHAFAGSLFSNWTGAPAEVWYIPGGERGTVAGYVRIDFPDLENRTHAALDLVVDPARRRAGIGTALLRRAAERAAADGRTVLHFSALDDSPGLVFARRAGAVFHLANVRRVQDLRAVPARRIEALRDSAAKAAAGYELLRWTGGVPEDLLTGVASVQNAVADAPSEPGVEPHRWDADLVRDRLNTWLARSGNRVYSVAAVHGTTGEMAAYNLVKVDPEFPGWGHLALTAVTRPHRGHRLGMLVKTEMTQWLRDTEPALTRIVTWNADANRHIIAINEELGYEVSGRPYRFAQLEVSRVLRQSQRPHAEQPQPERPQS